MADPFWSLGTATLTNGSAAVLVQGGSLLTSMARANDQIESDSGQRGTIASVNSATSITLDKPWRGATQTAAPYKIWYTPDEVELLVTARKALNLLGSGGIAALAGLAGAANKVPFFDGPNTMALADLTATGRALIAAATQLQGRNAIGAGDLSGPASAVADQVALFNGATGKLLKDSGISISSLTLQTIGTQDVSFDTLTAPGHYPFLVRDPSGGTSPLANAYFRLDVYAHGANDQNLTQEARPYRNSTPGKYFYRNRDAGTWGPWRRIIDSHSVLGSVSQAGGIPTDAIIERGSNANGEYTRLTDGTQECWLNSANFAYSTASNLVYNWTYPAPFLAGTNPFVSLGCLSSSGFDYQGSFFPKSPVLLGAPASTGVALYLRGQTSWDVGQFANNQRLFAKGRWA